MKTKPRMNADLRRWFDLLVAADQMNATQKALTRRIGAQVIGAGLICVNLRPSAVPFPPTGPLQTGEIIVEDLPTGRFLGGAEGLNPYLPTDSVVLASLAAPVDSRHSRSCRSGNTRLHKQQSPDW